MRAERILTTHTSSLPRPPHLIRTMYAKEEGAPGGMNCSSMPRSAAGWRSTRSAAQVPFAFEIPYDPAKIEERNSYAVQVRIEDAGKLLFISDTRHSVITRGAPTNVDIVVRPVGGPAPK